MVPSPSLSITNSNQLAVLGHTINLTAYGTSNVSSVTKLVFVERAVDENGSPNGATLELLVCRSNTESRTYTVMQEPAAVS